MAHRYTSTGQSPARAKTPGAFTLLEILTVLAILTVLGGLLLGVGRRAGESAKSARARVELATFSAALETYRRLYGDYPQVLSDRSFAETASGENLYAALNGQRGPVGGTGYFAQQQRVLVQKARLTMAAPAAADTASNYFLDPWGNPYRYAYGTAAGGWKNAAFVLFSAGPDGEALLPTPDDGIISPAYDAVLQDGRPVNADNLYANRD